MSAPLVKSNGLWSGTNNVSFHTLGYLPGPEERYEALYFDKFTFVGPRYRAGKKQVDLEHEVQEGTEADHWNLAFQIDPNKHELVVDAQERLQKRATGEIHLFKFDMTYSLTQVDTMAEEYAEIRRWNALSKLTEEEIKLLKLEKDFIYLKLKYSDPDKPKKKRSYY